MFFLVLVDLCSSLDTSRNDLYECEYEKSWLRMLNHLCTVFMTDVRPCIMLRRSFMWTLKPSGKVFNLEVESGHSILLVMNDGLKFYWLERYHIILRKAYELSCLHCIPALGDLNGRVNVIVLWTWYVTPLYEPLMLITLWDQWLAPSVYGKGSISS